MNYEFKLCLGLTEKQLKVIKECIEFYSNLQQGNFYIIGNLHYFKAKKINEDAARDIFNNLSKIYSIDNSIDKFSFIYESIKEKGSYKFIIENVFSDKLKNILDLYSRFGISQFDELNWFMAKNIKDISNSIKLQEVRILEGKLKNIYFPELSYNAFYSINGTKAPEECQIAYDILQVLRYKQNKYECPKPEYYSVDYSVPIQSSREPLPKCDIIQITDTKN